MRRRIVTFVVVCVASASLVVGYGFWGGRSGDPFLAEVEDLAVFAKLQSAPHVVFINTQPGRGYGRVSLAPLDALDGPRYLTSLRCDRVYFAGGAGLCLVGSGTFGLPAAYTFDHRFERSTPIALEGFPSRARVSPDGRLGASTVFVRGDSYASGSFSTRTVLLETGTGRRIGNLEEFRAFRDGIQFREVDFNYWGVTFARDDDVFYATLSFSGRSWLVQGRISQREIRLVRQGVECPSLSPDERSIVFKSRRIGDRTPTWHLRVLRLDSWQETPIADQRNIDDQATWLDEAHVLYSLRDDDATSAAEGGANVWAAAADGSGPPRLFLKHAYSPAIVRPASSNSAGPKGRGGDV